MNAELQQLAALQKQVNADTDQAATGNADVAAAQNQSAPLLEPGGLTALAGPGITVVLDDAATQPSDPNVDLNQLVVHQSDLQAVVNALWAGGAEAMTIAGQRVIPDQRRALCRQHAAAQRSRLLPAVPGRRRSGRTRPCIRRSTRRPG